MNDLLRRILFLPEQASTFALEVDHLHYFVIIVTMLASTLVGLTALVFLWRYREKKKNESTPLINPTLGLEAAFVTIPLALFFVWYAIGFRQFIELDNPPPDAMDIYVMGKQWMWKFSYPEGPNSVGVLHVPANRPVRLLLTSRDVIHSFYVPSFRVKKDVLPNRYTQTWFNATKPGRYQILCAEYCGANHSKMWGEVDVMPEDEFDTWLKDQQRGLAARQDSTMAKGELPYQADMVAQGERVAAERGCLRCHTVGNAPLTGGGVGETHIGPTWVDLYQRKTQLTNGQTILADEAYLTESMMDPLAKVVAGYQPVMPTYQGQLSGPEAAAIVEYIKSLRSDRVQTTPIENPVYEPIRSR
jgi:cytochrome c oxidase subunit 2